VLRPPASTPSPLSSSLVPASAPASAPRPSPADAAPVSAAAPPAAVSVSRGTAAPTIFSSRGGGCAFAVSRPIGWHSRASATAAAAAVVSVPSLSATPPIPVAPPAAAIRFPPAEIHPTTLPITRGATLSVPRLSRLLLK
ncbi:unnamed protein product, partial [Ectocarpus sp. 12 AP-2014]